MNTQTPHTKQDEYQLKKIENAYRAPPWWYDIRGFFILTFAYNSNLWQQVSFFSKNFGKNHAEIAIGSGTLFDIILKWRKLKNMPPPEQIYGIDYAESMLAGAIRRFKKQKNIQLFLADAANLPFDDNIFDTINIANAVHSFPNVHNAIKDVVRVTKPKGTIAVNILLYPSGIWPLKQIANKINHWGRKKGILHTPYTYDECLRMINDAGLIIISHHQSGNCCNILAQKPQT